MSFEFAKVELSEELKIQINRELENIDRRRLTLTFGEELEQVFRRYFVARYTRTNMVDLFVAVSVVMFFVLGDFFLVPEAIEPLFVARFTLFVTVCAVIYFVFRYKGHRLRRHHLIQSVLCVAAFWSHICLSFMVYYSAQQGANYYQSASLIVIIFLAAVLRLDLRYVMATCLAICVSHTYFVSHFLQASQQVIIEQALIFFEVAAFSCLASARMDYHVRKSFLQQLLIESDRKQQEEAKEQEHELSLTDPLTGLKNRRGLEEQVEMIWRSAIREQNTIAVLLADIDLFKNYNDSNGHQAGDRALKVVADVLRDNAKRPQDTIARLGGEEFIVVLPNNDNSTALSIAEIIREKVWGLNIANDASQYDARLTVSIGVASITPDQGDDFDTLVKQSDAALYQAKHAGRNRVLHYQAQGTVSLA